MRWPWLFMTLMLTPALLAWPRPPASADVPIGDDWTDWRVRSLRCVGLVSTDSLVILRELELQPGFGYSDRLLEEDAQAVKNTNLFARLVVSVNPDSLDESVDIVYAVSERPRWLAYPIISPTDRLGWIYGFGLMNRNLAGLGRRLDLIAEYGEHLSYSVYLRDPWFLGRRQPVSLYIRRSSSESADRDYRRLSKIVRISWTSYLDRDTYLSLQPSWQEITIHDQRAVPEPVTVNPRGLDVFGGMGISLVRNTTDFHVNPSRGGVTFGALNFFGLAGVNQPEGVQAHASASCFLPLPGALTCGANLSADLSAGRRAEYMKHYLGGRIGVRAGGGNQWPGWSTCHGSLELRASLLPRRVYFQRIDFGLGLVAFADGGLVWEREFAGRMLAAGGAGLGFRLFAPFIEVGRIDLGWSPTQGMMIHIGQGHAF